MGGYHQYNKGMPNSTHTDLPGVGPVPTGPRSQRNHDPRQSWKRRGHESNSDKRSSTSEVRRRRKETFRIGVRRPSPVPDHRTTLRQGFIPSSSVKPKTASAPKDCYPKSPPSEGTIRGRPLTKIEHRSPNRNESPGLFVPEEDSDKESKTYEDDDSDDSSKYDSTGVGAIGDYEVESGYDDSGDDDPASEEVTGTCQCPINLQCPRRAEHLIDCRPLVLEWIRWNVAIQPQFNTQLNAAVPPVIAAFTTAERVNKMHDHCERIKRHPEAHPSDRSDYKRIVGWAAEMHTHSITQEILTATQILPRLQAFLTPPNPNYHLQKRTPKNLLEELEVIFKKWSQGDLLADVNRGIIRTVVQTAGHGPRYTARIDPQWPYRMSDVFYGHGHLINGQRWFSRLQMSRAGAHGAPQAGICGGKQLGARSIVMGLHDEQRNEYYADIDKGETIWYVGTARVALNTEDDPEPKETNVKDTAASSNRVNRSPTHATQALMKSLETGTPVRVFRSYKLADIVLHKPQEGFRYDGLYRVVGWECLKQDRQIYRFKMRRLRRNDPDAGGQGPLRGTRRPRP